MIKKVVAIFPGRFQPMGRHHFDAYKWLANKFGEENTYIATSDKVDPPKSPLNFKEKKEVMDKYGIGNRVVQTKIPYKPEEILSKYDQDTTAVVFMVGQKDMSEDPRFKVGKKKDGSDTYFQEYEPNKQMEPYLNHGYLVVSPHDPIEGGNYEIPGVGRLNGTNIRKAVSSPELTKDQFKSMFGWYDEKIKDMLQKNFQKILKKTLLAK